MTTDQAFEKMINVRGIFNELGLTKGDVSRIRSDLRNGTSTVTIDRKMKLLQKAGYTILQDIVWQEPEQL